MSGCDHSNLYEGDVCPANEGWCRKHHPDVEAARIAKSQAKSKAEYARRKLEWKAPAMHAMLLKVDHELALVVKDGDLADLAAELRAFLENMK